MPQTLFINTKHAKGTLSRRQINDIFSYFFFIGNRIWHLLQIVPVGDNLHKMSKLFPGQNKKNIIKVSSAENFTQNAKRYRTVSCSLQEA